MFGAVLTTILIVVGLIVTACAPALAQSTPSQPPAAPVAAAVEPSDDLALTTAQAAMFRGEAQYYLELAKALQRRNAAQATQQAATARYWADFVAGLKPTASTAPEPKK